MATPTNLTDRISHLREQKRDSALIRGERPAPDPTGDRPRRYERRRATDYFMIFAYALLAAAMVGQILVVLGMELL